MCIACATTLSPQAWAFAYRAIWSDWVVDKSVRVPRQQEQHVGALGEGVEERFARVQE